MAEVAVSNPQTSKGSKPVPSSTATRPVKRSKSGDDKPKTQPKKKLKTDSTPAKPKTSEPKSDNSKTVASKPTAKASKPTAKASKPAASSSSKASVAATKPAKAKAPAKASKASKASKANTAKSSDLPADETKVKSEANDDSGSNDEVKVEKNDDEDIENENEDDTYRWWEADQANEGGIQWQSLEHCGVLFPPAYEPLPKSVNLIYDGKPVVLPPDAEEVAGFFGAMINTDHAKNETFQQNFFEDFCAVLKEKGGAKLKTGGAAVEINDFNKCDFAKIFEYYERQREAKRALPAAEKKRIKAEKDAAEESFKFCLLDGRKQPVGNFRIEPPGLFRGRGKHPKTGKLKQRVQPEQVTINIGKDAKIPEPPAGHEWAEVRHDNTVSWLAMWRENINGNFKYVFLAQNSSLKGMSDFKKFEKARQLKLHVDSIRRSYRKELVDKVMHIRQRATAMYLIDVLALRAGGEKGEDEADTVGCCSLRCEHVTLEPPNWVTFDFLGKDSIRYFQKVEVDKKVFNNLRIFKSAPKGPGDDIFDRLDPTILNKHLQGYMPGLTAKVFRTYNASYTMQQQLEKIPKTGTVAERLVAFNAANREVAILCNHQRTVSKGHETSMAKIENRIHMLEWQKWRLKKLLLQNDSECEKRLGKQYFSDMRQTKKMQLKQSIKAWLAQEKEKATKKHERDNEKIKVKRESGEDVKPATAADLKEQIKALVQQADAYNEEIKTDIIEHKGNSNPERIEAQIAKLDDRILNTRMSMKDKEDNSTVALSTSKVNYIDPRLTVRFSKSHDVPIEKLFTKTLREKFEWAIKSTGPDWEF